MTGRVLDTEYDKHSVYRVR